MFAFAGAIAAAELKVPGGYLADVGRRLRMSCLEQGVLLRPLGSVLYAMPPFCTSGRVAGARLPTPCGTPRRIAGIAGTALFVAAKT